MAIDATRAAQKRSRDLMMVATALEGNDNDDLKLVSAAFVERDRDVMQMRSRPKPPGQGERDRDVMQSGIIRPPGQPGDHVEKDRDVMQMTYKLRRQIEAGHGDAYAAFARDLAQNHSSPADPGLSKGLTESMTRLAKGDPGLPLAVCNLCIKQPELLSALVNAKFALCSLVVDDFEPLV